MHFLTSLFIFCGFVFVLVLGLVDVLRDLLQLSVQVSPHAQATMKSSGQAEGAPETRVARYPEKLSESD